MIISESKNYLGEEKHGELTVMSVNSSSSFNATLPPVPVSSSVNIYIFMLHCIRTTVGVFTVTAFTVTSILFLLPLYVLVLYLGQQRWREQRSNTTTSHSDVFTYHMAVMELVSVFGFTLSCCGVHAGHPQVMMVGSHLFIINLSGQLFFHLLTCVERYLAVIHPITYLSLRKAKGIRIRNMTIGCVWLLCFAETGLMHVESQIFIDTMGYCTASFALIVVSFCSISVLCVLIRPGPGEGGGDRQRIDQSKLRAFYTIMAILGVLLVRFGGSILSTALYDTPQLGEEGICSVGLSIFWFCLPSSLVLPLLFLQRAGKLQCCKNNNA